MSSKRLNKRQLREQQELESLTSSNVASGNEETKRNSIAEEEDKSNSDTEAQVIEAKPSLFTQLNLDDGNAYDSSEQSAEEDQDISLTSTKSKKKKNKKKNKKKQNANDALFYVAQNKYTQFENY